MCTPKWHFEFEEHALVTLAGWKSRIVLEEESNMELSPLAFARFHLSILSFDFDMTDDDGWTGAILHPQSGICPERYINSP